jgi:hypothetical protein
MVAGLVSVALEASNLWCLATLGHPDGFAMLQSDPHRVPAPLVMLLIAACLAAVAGVARAQSDGDVFRVSGIEVDVTASDAVAARGQAHAEGKRDGLARLLRRLVPVAEYGRLPAVGTGAVEPYVQNFEITNEELSSTRYLAKLTVRYDPEAVRGLLQAQSLSYAETPSVPIVVLPLWQDGSGVRLWPEDNPWWQAWADSLDSERLLRLVLPLGDLEDMVALTAAQAAAGETVPISNLAARYGSEGALLVTATLRSAAEAPQAVVELTARRFGRIEQQQPAEIVRGQPGQPLDALLAGAVVGLQDSLDERWKSANLLRFDQAGIMVVDIPITQLTDWVVINQGLESLPEVSQVEIAVFARDNVRAQIRYIGDQFRLEQAFSRLGLALSREGESWLLRPMGANPSPGEPPSTTSTAF